MGSGNYSKYSFTYSAGDVDFYGNDPLYPKILTSAESSFTVEGTKISHASASLSASATSSVTALEIVYLDPVLLGDLATVIVSLEVLKTGTFLDGSVTLSVSAIEEQYASAAVSGSATLTPTALEILIPGVDSASSNVNVTVDGTKVATADSSISITSDLTCDTIRIPGISLSVSGSVDLTATSFKFAYASISTDTIENVELTATAYKFAYSISSQSIDVDMAATSLKQAYSASVMSGSASSSITALEILFGVADLTSTTTSVVVGREILLGRAALSATLTSPLANTIPGVVTLSAESRIIVGATRFSPSVVEDVQLIRTLLSIDGKPLSEHNRKLSSAIVQSFVENQNWSATRTRYYKNSGGRKTFDITWTMLPSDRSQTVDLRFGRNKIKEIARDPDTHTLKVLNLDSDGTTPYTETEYTVLVRGYTEKLVRRDVPNDMYLWDCSLQLEEV